MTYIGFDHHKKWTQPLAAFGKQKTPMNSAFVQADTAVEEVT